MNKCRFSDVGGTGLAAGSHWQKSLVLKSPYQTSNKVLGYISVPTQL